ncbi:hypothetical protein DRJ17_02045 [Candidatus Woesearchaeota archaeon]|nr:MAG: hypothetical protein DRJ17_02045 [Candidatus Woesearchaeota archaeon]
MTKILGILSGKSGVGKTTVSMNLGIALGNHGKNVILVDADLERPNLGLYLGVIKPEATLHGALKGEISLGDALYMHRSGLKVILGDISEQDIGNKFKKLKLLISELENKADVVILDTGGFNKELADVIDLAIIVVSPEMPAVADALRAVNVLQTSGVKLLGCIVNKVSQILDVTIENIQTILGVPVIAVIPDDKKMKEAVKLKHPIVYSHPEADSSSVFDALALCLVNDYDDRRRNT